MKINVRPVAPKPIPATELKAGDTFVIDANFSLVYTRTSAGLGILGSAVSSTWGLNILHSHQEVYRYPAEPAATTVGELQPGDLFQDVCRQRVYMVGNEWSIDNERMCMLLSSATATRMGAIVRLKGDGIVVKVEVVE